MLAKQLLVTAASLALAQTAVAQDRVQPAPDLTFYQFETQVQFQGPTLVVLIPIPPDASPLDSTAAMDQWRTSATQLIAAARAVAEPLGYNVVARDPRYAALSALSGGAYYAAPQGTSTGYILVSPMLRPRLQRGYLPAEELEALLQDYQQPARALAL